MVYELFIDHEVSSGMIWDIVCVKKFMCIEQGGMGGCIEQGGMGSISLQLCNNTDWFRAVDTKQTHMLVMGRIFSKVYIYT